MNSKIEQSHPLDLGSVGASIELDIEYWNDGSVKAIKATITLKDGRSASGYSITGVQKASRENAIQRALETLQIKPLRNA